MLRYWHKYHHSIWSGILLLIRTLAGFGAQKVVAVLYGPAGTTIFSHFQNLVALFTQPIQDAVSNGLINAFPKKSLRKPQIVGASVIISVFLVLATAVILLISSKFKESYFSFGYDAWLLIVATVLLFCFGLLVSAVYIIQKKLKLYSLILLCQWVIFFSSVAFVDLELEQFLIFWLMIQAIFSAIFIVPIYPYLKCNFKVGRTVRDHFKQFLLMGLVIWVSSKWVDYYIREFAIEEFGTIGTGLWQSVVRISEAYRGLVISFLFLSLYPLLSQKLAAGKLQIERLRKYYWMYFLFSVAVLLIVFQFNEFILKTLYDVQYGGASDLFKWQIVGDVFAFLAFPFSVFLIASVQTKTYIITELLSACIFVTLILLMADIGIEILVYAHIARFICYLLIVSSLGIKKLNNVR